MTIAITGFTVSILAMAMTAMLLCGFLLGRLYGIWYTTELVRDELKRGLSRADPS